MHEKKFFVIKYFDRDKMRRSRSFDRRDRRSRSRSLDRRRRSRSPFDRRRDRRRSPSRSPNRSRKRSPFINEMVRQFHTDQPESSGGHPLQPSMVPMQNMGPGGIPFIPSGPGAPPGVISGPPQSYDPRMLPGGPTGLLQTPGAMPMGPNGPGMPMEIISGPVMHPGGMLAPQASMPGAFMGFEGIPTGPGLNYEPMNQVPPPPEYSSNPVIYNQGAPIPHIPEPSPQPVPAPGQPPVMYPMQSQPRFDPHRSAPPYRRPRSPSPVKGRNKEDRIRTPEPPIISDYKVINFNNDSYRKLSYYCKELKLILYFILLLKLCELRTYMINRYDFKKFLFAFFSQMKKPVYPVSWKHQSIQKVRILFMIIIVKVLCK